MFTDKGAVRGQRKAGPPLRLQELDEGLRADPHDAVGCGFVSRSPAPRDVAGGRGGCRCSRHACDCRGSCLKAVTGDQLASVAARESLK